MGRIKDTNYYQIGGWMINRLGLSGRELHAYAIIYGFTQDGETEFHGSINYIAEWLGSTRKTAVSVIKSLVEKKLVSKTQITRNGVKINYYKALVPTFNETRDGIEDMAEVGEKLPQGREKITPGDRVKITPGDRVKITPNNNSNNNTLNNKDNLLAEEPEADPVPYMKIKEAYNKICTDFPRVITVSPNRKKAIAARWKEYGGKLETFETLFTMTEESDFLKGGNERHWTATFDWLMKSANMTKVLEGNYRNKGDVRNDRNQNTKPAEQPKKKAMTTAELEEKLRKEGSFKGYPDFDAMFGGKKEGKADGTNG